MACTTPRLARWSAFTTHSRLARSPAESPSCSANAQMTVTHPEVLHCELQPREAAYTHARSRCPASLALPGALVAKPNRVLAELRLEPRPGAATRRGRSKAAVGAVRVCKLQLILTQSASQSDLARRPWVGGRCS